MADELEKKLRESLIALYAAHEASEITGDQLREALPQEWLDALPDDVDSDDHAAVRDAMADDETFNALNQLVKEQAEALDQCAARYEKKHGAPLGIAKHQIVECLRLLFTHAVFRTDDDDRFREKAELLADLILARYGKDWNDKLKAHFNFLAPKLRKWKLFFFSYANDNERIQGIGTGVAERAWESNSQLAEQIFRRLEEKHNLRPGFFDKYQIRTGSKLDEILEACRNSFFFIQLISPDSLAFKPENWSFREYETFRETTEALAEAHEDYAKLLGRRYMFAVAGDDLAEVAPGSGLLGPYQDWYDHIADEVHHKKLPQESTAFEKAVREIACSVTVLLEEWLPAP